MLDKYNEIKSILGVEAAAIKLFIIRYGIAIDGDLLAKEIPNYPQLYRTKRSKKQTALVEGKLIDSNTGDIPFVPEEIFFTYNGHRSVVKVNFREKSIFKIKINNGELKLVCEELNISLTCELSKRRTYGELLVAGKSVDKYVAVLGADRVAVMGFEGCSGWFNNTQCKFCDSNVSRGDETPTIPDLNTLNTVFDNDINKWLDSIEESYFKNLLIAYQIVVKQDDVSPHFHLHVMSGNMSDTQKEWEYMLRLSEVLNGIKPLYSVDSYLNLLPPPTFDFLQQAKDLGYRKLIFNMEVYGDRIYKAVCPEKYEKAPFDHFMNILKESVRIFGVGNIRCGFVLGAQPIEKLKEGCKILAEMGVVADFTVFTPKKGTPWEKKKGPEIFETAHFIKYLNELYHDYNFEALYCAESSRSAVMNEMAF